MTGTGTPSRSSSSTIRGTARGGVLVVHRHPHQLAPGAGQRRHLPHRRRHVGGVGVGHRLHDDGMGGSDGDAADLDGVVSAAREGWHGPKYNGRFGACPNPSATACRGPRSPAWPPTSPTASSPTPTSPSASIPPTSGSSPAPASGSAGGRPGRDHREHGRGGGAPAHGRAVARAGRDRGPDRRDGHARHGVPRHRVPDPGPARPAPGLGVRPLRGVLRDSSTPSPAGPSWWPAACTDGSWW